MKTALAPTSFEDFASAARAVLGLLHQRLGLGLWMITRVEGDHWVALQTENHVYKQDPVSVFRWAETFCARMVQQQGPRVAPDVSKIPAYVQAAKRYEIPIGAYVGVPLLQADGRLFGTLCGIDPTPQPPSVEAELPLVELLAGLLGSLLQLELATSAAERRAEQVQAETLTDTLTGLYNRRGWDTLLTGEEARCRRYGHPACVVSLSLEQRGASTAVLAQAGTILRQNARAHDTVARVSDEAFAILGVECESGAAEAMVARLRTALEREGFNIAIGLGLREPTADLYKAWEVADQAMEAERVAS